MRERYNKPIGVHKTNVWSNFIDGSLMESHNLL